MTTLRLWKVPDIRMSIQNVRSCDYDPLGKDEVISQVKDPLRGLPVGSYRAER